MENGKSSYCRFLEGEKDALTEIVAEYSDGLVLYINSIIHNICVSEELMEEVFVKLVTKKPDFSGKSTFKTWLYSIARYTALDYIKHTSRYSSMPVDEAYKLSDKENIEANYLREEQKIAVHKALDSIKDIYRQVIFLTFFEGFSNEETAQILHKTKRQIENLNYRAKQALKDELGREGFVYEKL